MEQDNTYGSAVDQDGVIRRLAPAQPLDADIRNAAAEDVQRLRDERDELRAQPEAATLPRHGDVHQEANVSDDTLR